MVQRALYRELEDEDDGVRIDARSDQDRQGHVLSSVGCTLALPLGSHREEK
jgi:hypothetical protein